MERKWRENEEMERDSLSTFPHFLLISSLSIHFLYQKWSYFVKYGTFVVNVTKNIRAMRNDSGSNTLREITASRAVLL